MKTTEYISARNRIIRNLYGDLQQEETHSSVTFHITSANLLNYLPAIDYRRHEEVYQQILQHQHLSALEQSFYPILEYVTYENLNPKLWRMLKEQPAIICTFHTGSYRLINLLLMKNQIPYSLVVSDNVFKKQDTTYQKVFEELYDGYLYNSFDTINAEQPTAGLKMLRDLKKGKSLMLYIDGNTGSGKDTLQNENNCCVRFLQHSIFARKGIAYLSHAANVPIIMAVCYRKNLDDIRLRFFDPIYPDQRTDRNNYAEKTTQQIYQAFEPLLKEYPEQWEAWLYLHKMAKMDPFAYAPCPSEPAAAGEASNFLLNASRYGLFTIDQEGFLFNKSDYTSYLLDQETFSLLSGSVTQPISRQQVGNSLLLQLLDHGVLVAAPPH